MSGEEGSSDRGFSSTMDRLERRLDNISCRFKEMDEAGSLLLERLQRHRQAQQDQRQAQQDHAWAALIRDSLSPDEVRLLFSYVSDTLLRCHSRVQERVPDLAPGLPTTAAILRRRLKNRRVDVAWRATLGELGLVEADAKALCGFFVTQGFQCEYERVGRTPGQQGAVESMIRRCVENQVLRDSLLRAVQVVEKGQAGVIKTAGSGKQTPSILELIKQAEGRP
ncbi:single-pass membrane and coiled-coil domain-containing protein 1-like [Osmerus eperlanus]|uniref:single-pass membrane and coiled-coil domain-containing protein 1-like n=1 Tax=Osmerus eperlanus TaxID=29151 RepID=UPI002E12D949